MRAIKTGGRQKGTPNKITAKIRQKLSDIVSNEIKNIPEYLNQIESPEIKLKLIIQMLPYLIPKQREISAEIEEKEPIKITPIYYTDSPEPAEQIK